MDVPSQPEDAYSNNFVVETNRNLTCSKKNVAIRVHVINARSASGAHPYCNCQLLKNIADQTRGKP